MNIEMRVLTVRQPWAWAILHGGKDVENRVRNVAGDYRGPVAIHAGRTVDKVASMPLRAVPDSIVLRTGGIIGVVDLVDVHDAEYVHAYAFFPSAWMCSPWAEPGVNHLVLADPRPLAHPIPFRGALGLRRLDAATIDLITKELP